jgi:adenosylcobinamide amidohydrolase
MKEKKIQLDSGDRIVFEQRAMIYQLHNKRRVLSTSPLNGGVREDLQYIFNYDELAPDTKWCQMKAKTYEEHLKVVSNELGLPPEMTTGLSTTVQMHNSAVKETRYHGAQIMVICTAGLDINAARAGEEAGFDELTYIPDCHKGTINLFLFADLDLHNGSMARLLITMTEAKTAAIQELNVRSNFSDGLATGSGTDGIVLVCSPDSEICLSNAGPHSKFGEIVSGLVKEALGEALFKQTGLDKSRQCTLAARMKGFGLENWLTEKNLSDTADTQQIPLVLMALRLIEEVQWGLISIETGVSGLRHLFKEEGTLQSDFDLNIPGDANAFKVFTIACLKRFLEAHSTI